MVARRAAFLVAAFWSLLRFVAVVLLVLRTADAQPGININLLWVGAGSLVLAAIVAAMAFLPRAERYYLPPARIGVLIHVITDVVVVLSGSYATVAERSGSEAAASRSLFVIAFAILAADLLTFAGLVSYRPMSNRTISEPEGT